MAQSANVLTEEEVMSETNVTPIRSIQEHVTLVLRKWDGLDRAREKHKSARLDLALELKDLRDRVEAGEAGDQVDNWWDWYNANIKRSQGDAEKLLAIAEAEDPSAAYEAAKAKDAANSQAYRERAKTLSLSLVTGKGEQNQSPSDVRGTVVVRNFAQPGKRAVATVPRYVDGPNDERLEAEIMERFRHLSWNGIEHTMSSQLQFVDRKHRGLE